MQNKFDSDTTGSILFPKEKVLNKTSSEIFSDKIRQAALIAQTKGLEKINPQLYELVNERIIYDELAEFIREHIKSVGQEQAVKDFQCGLNLLTGYKKETVLEEQIRLEEDADCLGLLAVQNKF